MIADSLGDFQLIIINTRLIDASVSIAMCIINSIDNNFSFSIRSSSHFAFDYSHNLLFLWILYSSQFIRLTIKYALSFHSALTGLVRGCI